MQFINIDKQNVETEQKDKNLNVIELNQKTSFTFENFPRLILSQ